MFTEVRPTHATTAPPPESPPQAPSPRRAATGWRLSGLVLAIAVVAVVALLSLAVGAKPVAPGTVVHELLHRTGSADGDIVHGLRIPRTLLGLAVGAALGLAGALMQALTRNPLADPGLLGVNAGAAAAVVTAIALLGVTSPLGYVWFALLGAAFAATVVYLLGSRGRSAATAVRLTLAGTAITAALTGYISGLVLLDPDAFNGYRFWSVGSLAGRDLSVLTAVGPFLLAGAVCALALARPLNALALGEERGRALGAHVGRTRGIGVLAVTLLCGAATAALGPIAFVGLTIPHIARALVGPDQRWILPYSMVLAPILLLGADIIGRVIARPGEIEVGIVTAFVGAPVLVALIRRTRVAQP
ncbi:iron complex transport system permease protein [Micromonospora pisi]|uniref:Iron complex transport system permease protein n=1 Tax=Micromonospora pisi TaxID=589240 RepID=A0A495JJA3_9ACTN|nr:iron chelate uptake ABC transporter family permease subunit [Micromonospora pisi]RKR88648.1 iron complex transport system permease protein [Micromonospora pisi]